MNANGWRQQARSMVSRATRAPSSHNTQPWFFSVSESTIELFADRTRALPVNDPDDRELTISCGCALMNLRVAAASDGFGVQVQILPEPGEPDLLARVCLSDSSNTVAEVALLAESIEHRHTYRKPFLNHEVTESVRDRLVEAVEREDARLFPLLTEEARQQAVVLITEGDKVQWDNPSWRRELAAWMHPRRQGDGLTVPTMAAPVARFAVRTFDMGDWVAGKDEKLAEASPLLVVLTTEGDEARDWLLAGQALQRVLLVACQHGLQACYLNQPIQVASVRPKLQDLVGTGHYPQIFLGFGDPAEEVTLTPRRPLEEIIE